jgi:hypothetical protein
MNDVDSIVHLVRIQIVNENRDEGLTPKIPEDCPPLLAEIMRMCWNKDPNQRPVSLFICLMIDFVLK